MKNLDPADPRYTLGHATIDRTHAEFIELVKRTIEADGTAFPALFDALYAHTREHFAAEEALMVKNAAPATQEHCTEHGRILADMRRFNERILADMRRFNERILAGRPMMARAWLRDTLPDWFALHTTTLDSVLAAHLHRLQAGQ
ncbi:MAG: hemerythrin family protein [Halothiobacillaceae bacterium]|jgi:hemerythrin-like metal-binding protein|nr:hemerythrin family protein [Halothiobacillaceae bacterium]